MKERLHLDELNLNQEFFVPSVGAEPMKYSALIQGIYLAHEYGEFHASQPARFAGRYEYGRDQMIKDLGDDVHPLLHMPYTEQQIVVPLLRSMRDQLQYSGNIAHVLRLAGNFHDLGENKHPDFKKNRVGDPSWGTKLPGDERKEAKIRDEIYGDVFDFIDDKQIQAVEDILGDEEKASEPAQIFEIAERLGYYVTGKNAGKLALAALEASEKQDYRIDRLRALAFNVTNRHIEFLRENEAIGFIHDILTDAEPVQKAIDANFSYTSEHKAQKSVVA